MIRTATPHKWNEHGRAVDDVEHVLANLDSEFVSQSSGLPCVFGTTSDGRDIIVVYEAVDADTIYPVTAYEDPNPETSGG